MTTDYRIQREPCYQPPSNEVTLYEDAYQARLPVMVKGPTGCGKSRFVEDMAWKLGTPLITVACNEDMTASDLLGAGAPHHRRCHGVCRRWLRCSGS